ncbi:MAG: magnesium transporter CorA family protein [Candidatus Saccharibacteria bacterium]|nr:magnesium transporter CorA family protein [Candidatus Saccharibacteria bacterium]
MISYFYKDVRSEDLLTLQKHRAGAWVCVEHPTADEIDQLVEKFNLDAGHLSDALDVEEMPRIEREGDVLYVFLRYAHVNDDLEISTSPLLIVLGPKAIITISMHSMPRLQQFTGGKVSFSTTQKNKLFLQILGQIVDQYDVYINNLGKRIKGIRTRLRTHDVVNQDFIDFVTIEDELNDFLSGLQPMSAMLHRLLVGKHINLYEQDEDIVEDLTLATEQSIEACRSYTKSISSIRDAHATIASNNLNRSMKILTVATVIIAIPNVFYGMYGMNVDLPFQHTEGMYFAVVGMTILLTILIFLLGRKSKIF